MGYKEASKLIFRELARRGYIAEDVAYLDGYFIFDFGKDSVVHFRVKGIKGWLCGIWFYKDKKRKGRYLWDFFMQYEKEIDKFKPSASTFVLNGLGLTDDGQSAISYETYRIAEMLAFVKKHPRVARAYDGTYAGNCWEVYYSPFEAWWKNISYGFKYDVLAVIAEKYLVRREKCLLHKIAKERFSKYYLADGNKDGAISLPRFKIVTVGEKRYYSIPKEEFSEKLQKQCKRYNKRVRKLRRLTMGADEILDVLVLAVSEDKYKSLMEARK